MWIVGLFACSAASDRAIESGDAGSNDTGPVAPTCLCSSVESPAAPVTTEDGLLALLRATQVVTWPELDGLALAVEDETDLAYFRASISTDTTLEEANADRLFVVSYDPVVLADPPDSTSLVAILTHELGHVFDYTGMSVKDYLEFGLWYGAQDPMESDELAGYERATDERALARGCAAGLAAMREWIYLHASAEVLAEKRRNYYTPEEISAWTEVHGACGG